MGLPVPVSTNRRWDNDWSAREDAQTLLNAESVKADPERYIKAAAILGHTKEMASKVVSGPETDTIFKKQAFYNPAVIGKF